MTTQCQQAGHLVFVDESGDHGLERIDPLYPVFVLAFCIVAKDVYIRELLPALTEFKFAHFGHDQVVLHEHDIRKDIGAFQSLRDPARKAAFLDELTALIERLPLAVVATVVRKDRLVRQYLHPYSPYDIGLQFGLERVHDWLTKQHTPGEATPVIIEKRGVKEDNDLELEFRRICDGNNRTGNAFGFTPVFVSKLANVPGLQIADLMARPIGRHVMDPTQPNRAYTVIEKKLCRGASGVIVGNGLKVFP